MFVIKFPAPGVMEVKPLNLSDLFQLKDGKPAEEVSEQNEEKGGNEDAGFCNKP